MTSPTRLENTDQINPYVPFENGEVSLPDEIWQKIHLYTGPEQLLTSALVSNRFCHICRDPWIWKTLCERAPLFFPKEDLDYRKTYFIARATERNIRGTHFRSEPGPFPKDAEFVTLNGGALCFTKNDGILKIFNAENGSFEVELDGRLSNFPLFAQAFRNIFILVSTIADHENGKEITEEGRLAILTHLKKLEELNEEDQSLNRFFEIFGIIPNLSKAVENGDLSSFITEFPLIGQQASKIYMHHLSLIGGEIEIMLPPEAIKAVAVSEDYAITAYSSKVVDVFDRKTGAILLSFLHDSTVEDLFIHDKELVIFSSERTNITKINLVKPNDPFMVIVDIKFCKRIDTSHLLLICLSQDVVSFNIPKWEWRYIFTSKSPAFDCCFDDFAKDRLGIVYQTDNDKHLDLSIFHFKLPFDLIQGELPVTHSVIQIPSYQTLSWDNGCIWLLDHEGNVKRVEPESGIMNKFFSPSDNSKRFSSHWHHEKFFIYTYGEGMQILDFSPEEEKLTNFPLIEEVFEADINQADKPQNKRQKTNN